MAIALGHGAPKLQTVLLSPQALSDLVQNSESKGDFIMASLPVPASAYEFQTMTFQGSDALFGLY